MVSDQKSRWKISKSVNAGSTVPKSSTSSLGAQYPEVKRATDMSRSGDADNSFAGDRSDPDLGTKVSLILYNSLSLIA